MSTTASFSTFVRPPGSPIYSPSGPSLVLPRRLPTSRSTRQPTPMRDAASLEVRRQISQVLALIRAAEELEPPMPAVDPQTEELAKSLQQLELKLGERERAVEEREFRIADRERDQAEAEVLLQHHEALIAAARRMPVVRPVVSEEERTALANLKRELDRQDALLREGREALREREKFVEECENRLCQKVQQQQEKETELEQREEEHKLRSRPPFDVTNPQGRREFDEFKE
ncbi:MAG: hypothetical protein ABW223_10345 [Rariglobus sp.]